MARRFNVREAEIRRLAKEQAEDAREATRVLPTRGKGYRYTGWETFLVPDGRSST